MQFNQEAYDTFFYWIQERQKIFLKRWAGKPKPWSEDPIFQQNKFCNVFRRQDKQSQYLINGIINPHWNDNLALLLFNLYAFRAFNWWPTYTYLVGVMGRNGWLDRWDEEEAKSALYALMGEGNCQLTSGAYMIRGMEGKPKQESIPEVLTKVWEQAPYLVEYFQKFDFNTLEQTQELLLSQKFWGWGPFTTYQIVLDMTYTKFLENAVDINEWCEFGPGAAKGIRCIWPDAKKSEMLKLAKQLQRYSVNKLPKDFPSIDINTVEFVLCELSKYLRIKSGGKGKMKYNGVT